MTNIADLTVGLGVDLKPFDSGLQQGAQKLNDFARTIQQSAVRAATAGASASATSIIAGLEQSLGTKQQDLAERVASGMLDPQAFAKASADAIAAFKSGLDNGLAALTVHGAVTDSIRRQFASASQAAASDIGQTFGAALTQSIAKTSTLITGLAIPSTSAASTEQLTRAENVYKAALVAGNLSLEQRIQVEQQLARVQAAVTSGTLTSADAIQSVAFAANLTAFNTDKLAGSVRSSAREFDGLHEKGGRALVGIAFALSNLAQGAGSADGPIRQILRSVSLLAIGFGTEGLLVSAIAAGTDSIIGIFTRTHDEMAKLQADFTQRLQQMQNAADVLGLESELQKVQIGQPSAGVSALVPTAFKGSLADLRADLAKTQAALDDVGNTTVLQKGLFEAGKEARDAQQHIDDLRKQIAPLAKQEKELQQAITNVSTAPRPALGLTPVSVQGLTAIQKLDVLVTALTGNSTLATAALAKLPDAVADVRAPIDESTRAAQRFVDVYTTKALAAFDAVERAIAAQGGAINDTTAKLGAMRDQLAKIPAVEILRIRQPTVMPVLHVLAQIDAVEKLPELAPVVLPLSFDQQHLKDLAAQLVDIQQAIQATQAAGLSSATSDELARQHDILGRLTDAWRAYIERLIAGGASAHDLAAALEQAKKAGVDVSSLASSGTNHLADDLRKAGDAASRIGQAFHDDVVTGIGAALDAVGNLKSAIDTLKAPDLNFGKGLAAVGEIGSAIGAVVGLISSAFGKSALDREHDRILQQNNLALADLRSSLDHFGTSGASLSAIQKALAGNLGVGQLAGQSFDPAFVARALAGTGVSEAQLEAFAKSKGLELLDSQGNLLADSFKALQLAVGATAFSLTHLSQAFDDQQRASELLRRATGNTDPLAALQDSVSNFIKASAIKPPPGAIGAGFEPFPGASGSQLFDAFFKGIDVTSRAGQQQFRDAIGRLVEEIQKGEISLAELGQFGSVQDLETALGGLLDDLDAFGNGLNDATQSLLNVPQGFKVALAEFNAEAPRVPALPPVPATPRLPPETVTTDLSDRLADALKPLDVQTTLTEHMTDILRGMLAPGGGIEIGGDFLKQLAVEIGTSRTGGGSTTIFQFGTESIVIQGTQLQPHEILDAVTKAAQQKSRALFGTTTRAAEVLNA